MPNGKDEPTPRDRSDDAADRRTSPGAPVRDTRTGDAHAADAEPLALDAMFPQTLHRLPDGIAFTLWISGAIIVPIILVYAWRVFFPPEY